jgi:thiol-disulfide isomerase/thioredoxin
VVEDFLNGVANSSLPFTIRHNTFPEEPPEVKLRQVNALTAEQAVMTKEAVTLLLAAARWCGHCHEFKPVLHAAAELLADENIRFFWMNMPENDQPKFVPEHTGTPMLWLWPAGENYTIPELFEGERDLPSLIEWIREKSGLDFPMPDLENGKGDSLVTMYRLTTTF